VEEKGEKDGHQFGQVLAYAGIIRRSRPDKPGVYVLHSRPTGYKIAWDDPSGAVSSPYSSWDTTGALVAYVNSLYSPPAKHYTYDPSVTLHDDSISSGSPPRWKVNRVDGKFKTIFVVDACYSRMTMVHKKEGNDVVFWKDSFRATGRRFEEVKILNKIHDRGYVPGVVQHNKDLSSDVQGADSKPITTASGIKDESGARERIKARLIMESTGEQMEKCPSVREALMVLYDVLEGESYSRCTWPVIY
jgi:hypothetical protein